MSKFLMFQHICIFEYSISWKHNMESTKFGYILHPQKLKNSSNTRKKKVAHICFTINE